MPHFPVCLFQNWAQPQWRCGRKSETPLRCTNKNMSHQSRNNCKCTYVYVRVYINKSSMKILRRSVVINSDLLLIVSDTDIRLMQTARTRKNQTSRLEIYFSSQDISPYCNKISNVRCKLFVFQPWRRR